MAAKTGRVRRPNPPTFQPDVPPAAVGPAGDTGGGFMSKKIAGVPMPIVLIVGVVVVYLVYRHYQANAASATSGTSSSSTAPDPNAVDPNTGLTYGAEEQAATNGLANSGVGTGTGSGGTGGGTEIGDLEGLLQSLQGLQGATNYYYGGGANGAAPTPTSDTPGNGTGSVPNITINVPATQVSPTPNAPAPTPIPASASPAGPAAISSTNLTESGGSLDEALGIVGPNPIIYNPATIAAANPVSPALKAAAAAVAPTVTGKSNGTGAVANTNKDTAATNAYNNPNVKANIH